MTQAIGKYLISVSAAAMLLSVTQSILPKGTSRVICEFAGGLLVMIAALSPIVKVDYDGLARSFVRMANDTLKMETAVFEDAERQKAECIKEDCEAYIWDKANELGADLEVEITLSKDAQLPIPQTVVLRGEISYYQRSLLSKIIEQDMGIPPKRQEWRQK